MGVLDKFEKGVAKVVNSAFAKTFRSEVKPVEIAAAIQREMDERTAAFRGRTVVPNTFDVELGSSDHQRVVEWGEEALAQEIAQAAIDHAREQGYSLVGPVEITFTDQPDLNTGLFRVHSSTVRADGAASPEGAARPGEPGVPHPGAGYPGAAAQAARQTPYQPAQYQAPYPAPEPPRLPVIDIDGRRYLLAATSTVLGRGSEADIVVDDTGVSRRHLELRRTEHGVIVTDLGSTNGTFVEGHRITAATLVDGNTITLGRTRLLFYTGESAPA